MKIKIEIKNYWTGAVLFEFEKENNTIKDTLLEAIKAYADLSYANLSYANLRYANLSYADLSYANLSYANLRYANLSYANLRYANLSYANLSYADLRYANLSYANLSYANLSYADLRYAKNIPDRWLDYWWHVHHEVLVEQLFEPIHNRINYIKSDKPQDEVELRLKLLKPVLGKFPTTSTGWEKLHKIECGCGWNKKTIFTKKNGLVK